MIPYIVMVLICLALGVAILLTPPFYELRANLRWQYLNMRYEHACQKLERMGEEHNQSIKACIAIRAQKLKIDKIYGKICRARAVRK